jgi:hypothetical protein
LDEKKSLFRVFEVPPPFESSKDVFCLRAIRSVDPYRNISFNNIKFKISGVPIRSRVQLHIVPNIKTGLVEIRFCYNNKLFRLK